MQTPKIQPYQLAIIGGVGCASLAWMYVHAPISIDVKTNPFAASSTLSTSQIPDKQPTPPTLEKAMNLAITSSYIFQSLIYLILCLFSQPPGSLIPCLATTPPTPITAGLRYSITKHVLGRLWRVSPIYDILEAIIIWTYRRRAYHLGKWKREKAALLALYYLRIRGIGEMSEEVKRVNRDKILEWKRTNQAPFGDLMGIYGEPKWFSASDAFVVLKVVFVALKLVYLKGWTPSVLLVKLLGAVYIASFSMVKLLEIGAIIWVDDVEISHVAMEQEEDEFRCWVSMLFAPSSTSPASDIPLAENDLDEPLKSGTKTPTKEKREELTPPPTPPITVPAPFEDFTTSDITAPPTPPPPSAEKKLTPQLQNIIYKKDSQGRRLYPLPTPDSLSSPPTPFLKTFFQTILIIQNTFILPLWILGYWNLPQFTTVSFLTSLEVLTITSLITLLSSTIIHVVTEMILPPILEKCKHIQLTGLKNRIGWLPSLLSDVFLKGRVDYHATNVQCYITWIVKFVGIMAMMSGGLNRAGITMPEIIAASWKVGKPVLAVPVVRWAGQERNRYLGVVGANLVLLALLVGRFYEVGTCGVKGFLAFVTGYREGWTEWIL